MSRHRHWRNFGEAGEASFVSTACLDHAHCFARPEIKSLLTCSIAADCLRHGAKLYGYVVMSNHIHLLVQPQQSISTFMQGVKRNAASRILPNLIEEERVQLRTQVGLDGRRMWQRSFRSFAVDSEMLFRQKLNYIEENPVRAGLCTSPDEYFWSSAHPSAAGLLREDQSLDLRGVIKVYSGES